MQTSVECKNNYFRKKSRNISWKEKKRPARIFWENYSTNNRLHMLECIGSALIQSFQVELNNIISLTGKNCLNGFFN